MTTVALPCPSPARVGGVFGALVDAIIAPLRRLTMSPRERHLNALFRPIIQEIGALLLAAEDRRDLADLLDEAAVMPHLLAFEALAAQELAIEIDAFVEASEDIDADAFVALFGDGNRSQAREMAHVFEAQFELLGRFGQAPPVVAPPEPFDAIRDLACPPDLARALTAGLRSEAALLALMHGLTVEVAPWLRRALTETALADRRRALAVLAGLIGADADAIIERVGVTRAPLGRWLDEYHVAREALAAQVEAARGGRRRPFEPKGDDG